MMPSRGNFHNFKWRLRSIEKTVQVKDVENQVLKPFDQWRDELYGYWMVYTDMQIIDGVKMVVARYYGTDKEKLRAVQANRRGYGAEVRHCCVAAAELANAQTAAAATPQSLTPTPLYRPLAQGQK